MPIVEAVMTAATRGGLGADALKEAIRMERAMTEAIRAGQARGITDPDDLRALAFAARDQARADRQD